MRSEQPKQYLSLLGQPLIRHTLAALCASPVIDRVYVVLSVGDQEWDRHDWTSFGNRLVPLFCGGASRADSVLNGLRAIADEASESDWVLVHDAARPCLAPWHIETLVRELSSDEVGGILAVPVADTLNGLLGRLGAAVVEPVHRDRGPAERVDTEVLLVPLEHLDAEQLVPNAERAQRALPGDQLRAQQAAAATGQRRRLPLRGLKPTAAVVPQHADHAARQQQPHRHAGNDHDPQWMSRRPSHR